MKSMFTTSPKLGGFQGAVRRFGNFIGNQVAPRLAKATDVGSRILGGLDKAVKFVQGVPVIGGALGGVLGPLDAGLSLGQRALRGVSNASGAVAALGEAARTANGTQAQQALGSLAASAQGARSAFEAARRPQ